MPNTPMPSSMNSVPPKNVYHQISPLSIRPLPIEAMLSMFLATDPAASPYALRNEAMPTKNSSMAVGPTPSLKYSIHASGPPSGSSYEVSMAPMTKPNRNKA